MYLLIAEAVTSDGISIAIAGLSIVFLALMLISLFIAALPRVLAVVARVWPEVDEAHSREVHPENRADDEGAVFAAIGFVLHTEFQKQLSEGPSGPST